jgi:hypothetical protein
MIRLQSLSSPDSRSTGVIAQNVEDPSLGLVDHGESFSTFTFGGVSAAPVGSIEAKRGR